MTPSQIDVEKSYQNARVEKINCILKYEFGLFKNFENINTLRLVAAEVIHIYNKFIF